MEREATNISLAMRSTTVLFKTAKQIYRTEGLTPLLRRGFAFVEGCFFRYETYYLYELPTENVRELNEADFLPNIDNFILKTISTNQEADDLEADGFEFRSQVINARERLDNGAIAFCIFVEQDLAHIGWVAMSQEGKDSLNEPPYKTDCSAHEAWWGGVWTNPKYRRMGLLTYADIKRLEFLLDKGIVTSRYLTTKGNIASLKSNARFNSRIYGEGRYLRILWWKLWKERPLSQC